MKHHNIGVGVVRLILLLIGLVGLALFLFPIVAFGICNIGSVTGAGVALLCLVYGIAMQTVHALLKRIWKSRVGKVLLCLIGTAMTIILVLVVILSTCMIHAATNKPSEEKTIIVLGCQVYGERASRMLVNRLEAAYDYMLENEEARCIVSGGQGSGEEITEAECMYRYLVAKGVSPERIYKEEKSTSTRENLAFSKEIIEENQLGTRIVIATNEFHEYRAGRIARSLGLTAASQPGITDWWLFPTYYVRELYGILYEWFL